MEKKRQKGIEMERKRDGGRDGGGEKRVTQCSSI